MSHSLVERAEAVGVYDTCHVCESLKESQRMILDSLVTSEGKAEMGRRELILSVFHSQSNLNCPHHLSLQTYPQLSAVVAAVQPAHYPLWLGKHAVYPPPVPALKFAGG